MYKNLCWVLFLTTMGSGCGLAPRDLALVAPAPVSATLSRPIATQTAEPEEVEELVPAGIVTPSTSDTREPRTLDNVYDLGESNHAELFKDYVDVETQLIEFSNDSKRLDVLGILALRDLSKRFVVDSDIVSVIGCSIGKTSLRNGNLRLAQGRTNVVKDELLFNDVPVTSIFDELCWGGDKLQNSGLPERGVRVALKRKR